MSVEYETSAHVYETLLMRIGRKLTELRAIKDENISYAEPEQLIFT